MFSGLFRTGALSAAQLLGVQPDIACYAKLMTAGVLPMAATLTTEAVFDAFKGPSKVRECAPHRSTTAHYTCTHHLHLSWYCTAPLAS